MGELILCGQMLAAFPYYIDNASLNVYSLEELSYYIENNLYLLEADFMNEELCTWIDTELRLRETAEKLREILHSGGTLAQFVTCILGACGYCSREKSRQIASTIGELGNKSEYECGKIRADRYVENKRYINAIYEYRRLLQKDEEDTVLVGNVWHNLGKAYACLYFFPEAVLCFKRAYEKNENPESLRECLYACRCMGDEKRFGETAAENGVSAEEMAEIRSEISELSRMDEIKEFESRLDELFASGKIQEIASITEDWKDTYRKNCRI